jgi:hypothetical protein
MKTNKKISLIALSISLIVGSNSLLASEANTTTPVPLPFVEPLSIVKTAPYIKDTNIVPEIKINNLKEKPKKNIQYYDEKDEIDNSILEYTIVKNDTLWDISTKFFDTPYLWHHIQKNNNLNYAKLKIGQIINIETMWSQLDYNTNIPPNLSKKSKVIDVSKITENGFSKYLMKHILFDTVVFYDSEIEDEKLIISSENNQKKISILDKFYVNKDNINLNDKYRIYRKYQEIEKDQYEYSEIGEAVVDEVLGGLALLQTVKSRKTIRKGDLIIKIEESEDLFLKHISKQKLNDKLKIKAIYQNKLKGTLFDFVILDKTSEDINIGSIYKVYSEETIIVDPKTKETTIIPSKEKGRIVITKINENYNIGMVSKVKNSILKGDYLK